MTVNLTSLFINNGTTSAIQGQQVQFTRRFYGWQFSGCNKMTREERDRIVSEWMAERYPERYELRDGRAEPRQKYLDEIRNKIEKIKSEEPTAPKAKAEGTS